MAGIPDAFVHLHVASGYSMRYGASTPSTLVQRAVAWGQPALALTDRDGLYGAVRFVQACAASGIAPILGVDLAVRLPPAEGRRRSGRPGGGSGGGARGGAGPGGVGMWGDLGRRPDRAGGAFPPSAGSRNPVRPDPVRTPVRGGAVVDSRLPRVTVLARGRLLGIDPGAGWARLCQLVTRTHLSGERGDPVSTPELIAELARPPGHPQPGAGGPGDRGRSGDPGDLGPSPLVVLLGPDSDVGRAALARRRDLATEALARWRALLPRDALAIEVVCHGGPEGTPANLGHAARLYALARDHGIRVVLTAAVRHADPQEAATVDVLDAARRLVPLDVRHLDRVTTAGHLSPTPAMYAVACDILQASGPGISGGGVRAREGASALLASTVDLAMECILDPALDLGLGAVHLPEQTVLGISPDTDPLAVLVERCRAAIGGRYPTHSPSELAAIEARLDDELEVIGGLGYPTYFLTVAAVVDLIKEMGIRVAARGSGAGCLVNYLLGISGVDPMRYGLLMERFCSPLRAQLPDIDIDVEAARRTEIYERVLERFGGERVTCVSMMDSYRVRHAIRDVGAALGLPPSEIDAMAKAFPHISARNVRHAIADLPELRASGLNAPRLDLMLDLVERLDGLPRHIALHPCGVVLSNSSLLQRTPVEASWIGFPMSQFDKDDVEALGLLKLDILGIRMQSAMAHAVDEVRRVEGVHIDLDDRQQVALDDEPTFRLIRTTHTLGCFQIESPGQRELIGKFGPESFEDLITDISLFRPGPVKSDMIVPFLNARQGWAQPEFLHPTLIPALQETEGVVVFHEQVLLIVAETTGVTLAQADEVRRAMGSPQGQTQVEAWWRPAALARGYPPDVTDRIWEVLKAFASFGFCKAHAAAFALPTYQSAWLKTHHPAAFLSGVLTHDPGMYPKRLILDDARSLGIAVLGLDVNASTGAYVIEKLDAHSDGAHSDGPGQDQQDQQDQQDGQHGQDGQDQQAGRHPDLPDGRAFGIRISLADVKGISGAEVARVVAGQPYADLADFWRRAHVGRPIVERLVLAGGFDSIYGVGSVAPSMMMRAGDGTTGGRSSSIRGTPGAGLGRRGRVTRRDLLLHVAELDRWSRSLSRSPGRAAGRGSARAASRAVAATAPARSMVTSRVDLGPSRDDGSGHGDIATLAAAQSQAARSVVPADQQPTQLLLDLGDAPRLERGTGLPEMTGPERVRAELDILGLDASAHIVDFYGPMLDALGVTRSMDLLQARNRREVWIAGVKVATQTPPVRSGRRVVFLTLDDATGPADATFFEDTQGPYAGTVFHSWMLLVRGVLRRTGPRGVSVRATGAWELSGLWEAWTRGGLDAVLHALEAADEEAVARNEAALVAAEMADGRALPAGIGGGGGGREAGGDREAGQPHDDLRGPHSGYTDAAYTDAAGFDLEHVAAEAGHPGAARTGGGDETGAADRRGRAGGMGGSRGFDVPVVGPVHGAGGDAADRGRGRIGVGRLVDGIPTRRVLVHASGFKQSPYADIKPAGSDARSARELAGGSVVPDEHPGPSTSTGPGGHRYDPYDPYDPHEASSDEHELAAPPRKLWHSSPGSSGH